MSLSFGTQKSAETVTLACHGQIVAGNEGSALRQKVQQLMKDSPNVILDLRNVSYIDGSGLGVLVIGGLAAYIGYKFIARQRFLRELRIARITVDELKKKIDAGEELVIVDLRHSLDFEADPHTIPGAFRMDAKDLEEKDERLPRDRDVVLYCT